MRSNILIVSTLVLFAAGVATALVWWPKSLANYEECMLSEMKGHAQSMQPIVEKVCARRFKKERVIETNAVDYEFVVRNQIANVLIKSKEYDVTRLEAAFTGKNCQEAKFSDWGTFKTEKVLEGLVLFELQGKEVPSLPDETGCMKARTFYGMYK